MQINVNKLNKHFLIFKRQPGLYGAFKSFFNRKYEKFNALKNISLSINEGEILGILGENGAGKTTLIKLLVGLLHPTSGNVNIENYVPWERDHKFLKNISIVMGQKNQLWWDIPASESFLLNQKIYEVEDKKFKERLNELVDLLDVREKIDLQVRRLSLGERMKMEIIAALLHSPKIVLLDEPTIGLDVISQSKIREFINYYNEQYRTTFILTSHYMRDIQALCKRVFVINKGVGIYDGNFKDLVRKINPKRKLFFEFSNKKNHKTIIDLSKKYNFDYQRNFIKAELSDKDMTELISELFKIDAPATFRLEDLPVDDTMKSFFANPDRYL